MSNERDIAAALTRDLAAMVMESVVSTYALLEDTPIDKLQSAVAERGITTKRLAEMDWDRAREVAPVADLDDDGDVKVSLATLVQDAAFYSRLYCRLAADGVMDGDAALLGFCRVWGQAVVEIGRGAGFPAAMSFIRDFTDHCMNMAVANGSMVPVAGVEGEYHVREDLASDDLPKDAAIGPFGLTKEQFLMVDFPHGEEIYDTLMDQICLADSCILPE